MSSTYNEQADRLRRLREKKKKKRAAEEGTRQKIEDVQAKLASEQRLGNTSLGIVSDDGMVQLLTADEKMAIHKLVCRAHEKTSKSFWCTGNITLHQKHSLCFPNYDIQTEMTEHIDRVSLSHAQLPCSTREIPLFDPSHVELECDLPKHLLMKQLAEELVATEQFTSQFSDDELIDSHFLYTAQAGLPLRNTAFLADWQKCTPETRVRIELHLCEPQKTFSWDFAWGELMRNVRRDLALNKEIMEHGGVLSKGKLDCPNTYWVDAEEREMTLTLLRDPSLVEGLVPVGLTAFLTTEQIYR